MGKLKGKHIRAKSTHTKVIAIGNYLENKWFNPDEDFKDFFSEQE